MFDRLRAAWLVVAISTIAPLAGATPTLESSVSADRVEVGRTFRFELNAMSSDGPAPANPRLVVPQGFQFHGPSVSTQQRISIVNGRIDRQQGITATWSLVGAKPGRYTIGPPSVESGGSRINGDSIVVEVVPAGSLPQRAPKRRRRGGFFFDDDPFDSFDPFDLLPRMQRPLDDLLNPDPFEHQTDVPEELVVERPSDPIAFLRATAEPREVVVGEQVLLRIYAYGARGPFDELNTSEPSRADFLSHVIVENSYRQPRHQVPIDGMSWHVVKVREVALFPLRAGTLTIGPMRMGFRGRRYPASAPHEGLVRHSEALDIVVKEPPIVGRPPGYELGTVGRFGLGATVEPRAARAGDAVKVVVSLSGRGNLPSSLILPQQKGVEWSEPVITTDDTVQNSEVGGTRRFSYVVELSRSGNIELGEVSLPYYDPQSDRYEVARASLGSVDVSPSSAAAASSSDARNQGAPVDASRLENTIAPRTSLGPGAKTPWRLTDSASFWALLAVGPLSVLTATGLVQAGRRLRKRLSERRLARATGPQAALREAEQLRGRGDHPAMASAIERAVYAGIEQRTGLKARGVLRSELSSELGARGVNAAFAQDLVALLNDCDALRFSKASADSTANLVKRARTAIRWDNGNGKGARRA